jgi:hypothetical protein
MTPTDLRLFDSLIALMAWYFKVFLVCYPAYLLYRAIGYRMGFFKEWIP